MTWTTHRWQIAYEKSLLAFAIIVGSGIVLNLVVCLLVVSRLFVKHGRREIHSSVFLQLGLTVLNEVLIGV